MTGYESIEEAVAAAAGLDAEAIGRAAFARCVDGRMARRGIASRGEYAALLGASEDALQDLIEALAVPETWFFRDSGPYDYLRNWAQANAHRYLRVLSVPCSTGEEPYSIAITLLEAGLSPERFSIDAADLSRHTLEIAARAVYGKSSFRESRSGYRAHFTAVEDGLALSKDIAQLVRFRPGNLVDPGFLAGEAPYDVLFCRNLLIYLRAEARRAVWRNLDRLLAPGGVLVVGASELPAFLQSGYAAVPYPYSFACTRVPYDAPRGPQPAPRPVPAPARRAAAEPTNEASLETAWQLADQGAIEPASQICDRLLAAGPAGPELYYLKGLLNETADRLEAAEEFFRKALYLDPEYHPALLHMSALCDRRGERATGELFRMRARRTAEHESRH